MVSVAIFLEGQTERKFIRNLIGQRYGHLRLRVKELVRKGKPTYISNEEPTTSIGLDYHFLLVEVPSREKLFSYVFDNASNMVSRQGYSLLLGLQDLFPSNRSQKASIMNLIDTKLRKSPVYNNIAVVLAIMETEAWFLCDWQMFGRINNSLTASYIQSHLGLNITHDDPELSYNHPSETLDDILKLIGLRYRKHESEINLVAGNIDVQSLLSCAGKIDSFFNLIGKLDSCIPS
ncbi:DUF4276 family protein [Chloroflexota bacterium]